MTTILFVHHISTIGGGSYCLLNILREIDRDLFRPIVLLKNAGPLTDELEKLGISYYFLSDMAVVPYNQSLLKIRSLVSYINIIKSLHSFSAFLSKHKEIDIVYLNNMMLAPFLKIAKQHHKKTLIHIREHWPHNEHKLQLRRIQNMVYQYADQIIAINQYSASLFPSAKSDQKHIVYDWIDFSDRYKEMPLKEILHEDTSVLKVFLYTGGTSLIKGCIPVLRTFSSIHRDDYRLIVMGNNFNISTNNLRGRIKLFLHKLGYNTYQYKIKSILDADSRIYIIPSTYQIQHLLQQVDCVLSYFTIPHANLILAESIINNTICIAAQNEEALEYSDNGKLALLFTPNDMNDFRNTILSFESKSKELYSLLKRESYKIKDLFDKKVNVNKLNEVLKSLLTEC